jgi:DNA-binding NarL/FixJ family response regulator
MDGPARVPLGEDPITVFLLDDHELVRRGVRTLLESEPGIEVVGESGSAIEGEERIAALRPRVAIVDGRLPDGSGIEVCRQVRSADRHIEVLVLTSYDDDDALFAAILAGASGYVLKQISGGDLVTAVRRVAAGQSMLDPAVTTRVLHRLRQGSDKDPLTKHLTPKEEQVLGLVAEGLTNRQIAERLGVAEKTVKNYVSTLLAKLGVESRTQAAVMAARRPLGDDHRSAHPAS